MALPAVGSRAKKYRRYYEPYLHVYIIKLNPLQLSYSIKIWAKALRAASAATKVNHSLWRDPACSFELRTPSSASRVTTDVFGGKFGKFNLSAA